MLHCVPGDREPEGLGQLCKRVRESLGPASPLCPWTHAEGRAPSLGGGGWPLPPAGQVGSVDRLEAMPFPTRGVSGPTLPAVAIKYEDPKLQATLSPLSDDLVIGSSASLIYQLQPGQPEEDELAPGACRGEQGPQEQRGRGRGAICHHQALLNCGKMKRGRGGWPCINLFSPSWYNLGPRRPGGCPHLEQSPGHGPAPLPTTTSRKTQLGHRPQRGPLREALEGQVVLQLLGSLVHTAVRVSWVQILVLPFTG